MAWRELWLPSDVELKRLLKVSLHVLAVSMRARDCCMRECRWMCNYYIGGGGRCGLASVHGCTLACMYALLHAGCRTGGLGENMRMPDIKVYNPHITMYIESGARNCSAAFYWSSSGCWMGFR